MREELVSLLSARKGHFRLESGHHGDLWLDLELLCLRPRPIRRFASQLAGQLAVHRIDAVCGPLVEGAFVALMVASELDVEFTYAERSAGTETKTLNPVTNTLYPVTNTLYPVTYTIPGALRGRLAGKRVAIVNDVINAGSAVRGTFSDLQSCGATPVAIGALVVLGTSAAEFAANTNTALESVASLPNAVWTPEHCPLCASGVPIERAPR